MMKQAGEPSVDEILQSIKKVIARDNRAVADERRARESAPEPAAPEEADEILDLSELAALPDSEDVAPAADGPLLAEPARDSMRESLAALAMLAEPPAAPQIVRSGETSLEQLTRELLRPALAQWLDANLPAMVERMVAAEIARIVGKKA